MTEAICGCLVALGLFLSVVGSWKASRATPLVGGDKGGYLSVSLTADVDDLLARHRHAWHFLLGGFVLQLVGTLGLVVTTLARAP